MGVNKQAWPKGLVVRHRVTDKLLLVLDDKTFSNSVIYNKYVSCVSLPRVKTYCPNERAYTELVHNCPRTDLKVAPAQEQVLYGFVHS